MTPLDILIPTYRRPTALAVTLTSLCSQTLRRFRIIISDQTEETDPFQAPEVQAVVRLLRTQGHPVEIYKHLPRRGMAEQRQFLLDQAQAPTVLFLDDDLILESDVVQRMLVALEEERCGFVGCSVIGLSYLNERRPHEQRIEFWDGPVQPESIRPGTPQWERYRLHNAANLYHVQQSINPNLSSDDHSPQEKQRKYRVAWVGGCVMYDVEKLRDTGGFSFWKDLPLDHCGEDVLAQIRVMSQYGGCGLIPSGVYHQELPTTLHDRSIDAPKLFGLDSSTFLREGDS